VGRCICRGRSFGGLLAQARAGDWDLDTLVDSTGCGAQCGLCRPYLSRMLATGQTVFHALLSDPPPD